MDNPHGIGESCVIMSALRNFIIANPKRRAFIIKASSTLNRLGIRLMSMSRAPVRLINAHVTEFSSDRYIYDLPGLHAKIRDILSRQKKQYEHYSYFDGQPYQSLAMLGIFGERPSEERFVKYGLSEIIDRQDRILDIGCNCGFMAIVTAYRTGCNAVGIDINPYMIEIGNAVVRYLGLESKVDLRAGRFQDYTSDSKFSVVFSFATHWTDDGNYRVGLSEHFARIAALLNDSGVLVFETHSADVGQKKFYDALQEARSIFEFDGKAGVVENGTREFYVMRKRGST